MATKQPKEPATVTNPQTFPSVLPPNYPSANYDFTLQAVMEMQKAVGQLCSSVESLKDHGKDSDRKLDEISTKLNAVATELHGAKIGGKVLLWVISVFGALIGICLGAYFQAKMTPAPIATPPIQASPR